MNSLNGTPVSLTDAEEESVVSSNVFEPTDYNQGEVLQQSEHAKDEKYYLEFVTLLVEGCLFVVPKHHFMRYKGQFNCMWGMDEETQYKLDDVEKADFRAFLKFLYPLYLPKPMTTDDWISVLKLASKWMMLDIRETAMTALDAEPPLLKIVLAREYGVPTWLQNGYLNFSNREESLSVDDVQALGLYTALKLINMREESLLRNREQVFPSYRQSRLDSHCAVMDSCSNVVDDGLSQELEGVSSARGFDAVARVLWARSQNNVQSLRLAYIELTGRMESISLDEASKLGLETTANICRARERFIRTNSNHIDFKNSNTDMAMYFRDEFDAVTRKSMLYVQKVTRRDQSREDDDLDY